MLDHESFVGRKAETAEIQQLLAQPECQLLSLVGPGGIGKTQLALHVCGLIRGAFADGLFVVYLQPLESAELFVPAVADALGVSLTGHEPPLLQLGRYLSGKEALVILDNFEHLLTAADQLSSLFPLTPHVKYLVTSREALNLQEEWLYQVPGLTFPASADTGPARRGDDAVHLFNERAQRVYPSYSPEKEVKAVIEICRLVGGMPLALELAAAWRNTLSCHEIAEEIRGGLDFLATRLRNVEERHQSMQTVFDQTWRRLNQREQDVCKRLSVFRGGIQRDAIVKVTRASLPILASLVDKSLLRLEIDGRYRIHELLRQYAAEHLKRSPGDEQGAQAAHAAYYIQFLHERSADVCGGRQREALLEIRAEIDNIRIAWSWAVAQGDADALRRGSEALGLYYQFLGGYLEGMTLFSQATAALQARPQSDARDIALLGTRMYEAWYHLRFGRQEGTEACMAQSQAIYRRLNIPPLPGYLTDPNAPLSFVALTRGDYATALRFAEQVCDVAEAQHHPINRQFAYHLLAEANFGLGELETAQKNAQQAYAQALATGDSWFMAYILINTGRIVAALGDIAMSKTHFRSSYEIRHAFDDPEGMALALINLGNLALKEHDLAEAEALYQRSWTIYQDINDKGGLATANFGLGIVSCEHGDFGLARSYFKQALQLAIEIDYRPVLFGLLVSIAELLWRMGQRDRALSLLALTIHNPTTDHETQKKAQQLLVGTYQKMVPSHLFAAAIAAGEATDLGTVTAELLYQFSLPANTDSVGQALTETAQTLIEPLTTRESEVLRLLATGLTNAEIAERLGIAIGTVKFYTGQIYGKLGTRNRVAAIARARELNLVKVG